jgi:predicted nucleic acid-binding protein
VPGRSPTPLLVVDANIIVSAVLGLRSGPALAAAGERLGLATSDRAAEEVVSTAGRVTGGQAEAVDLARSYLTLFEVVPSASYRPYVDLAALVLRRAVASRNVSAGGAHLLALAWMLDADIWSHDRDFAGTGWPSWSSANLLAYLAGDAAPSGGVP